MRLAFFVNDVATEVDEYTTTRLARAAAQGRHEVWYVGVGDVELGERDGQLVARRAPGPRCRCRRAARRRVPQLARGAVSRSRPRPWH